MKRYRSPKKLLGFRKLVEKLFRLCDRILGKLFGKLIRPHQYPQLRPLRYRRSRTQPYTPEHAIAPSLQTVSPQEQTVPGELVAVSSPAKRSDQVKKLLEEAWDLGHQTYPARMNYIEGRTGESCSRRTIAAWKKSRTAA